MRFEKVIGASVYGTIGRVTSRADLGALERTIVHNLPVLRRFRQVLVATNYGGEPGRGPGGEPGVTSGGGARGELAAANEALWRRHFPDCVLLDSALDRGHSIGTADLDNLLFDHCKAAGIQWLCKGANDVLLSGPVLHIEVRAAEFYYLNGISVGAMQQQAFDIEKIRARLFFPQTYFYAIDVAKTDYLVDKEFLDRSWAIVRRIPDYTGRIWEYIPGWSCETLLRKCVQRNGLSRCHLLDEEQFTRLLETVRDEGIADSSFKGLTINGICHRH